jgi:ferric-dicitrate binding protein FerR (iron transport regulator)
VSDLRDEGFSPEGERARRAIRAGEPEPPRADAAFRERLRGDFVSGRLDAAGERSPGSERGGRLRQTAATEPGRPWFRRPLPAMAALAAAAMLAVFMADFANRGPDWTLLEAAGTGEVVIDGDAIPIHRADLLAERIKPGVEVEVPATGTLEILSPKTLLVELTPGTKLTIPPPPPRYFNRNAELWTRAGLLRLTTGPSFSGARLDLHTPDAVTRITGTTIAVIMEPMGTCVCVLEGEVDVGPQSGGPMMAVGAGRRGYVFRDGRPLATDSIRETEMLSLARFRSTRIHILESEAGKQ